jgi:hypothetical protein
MSDVRLVVVIPTRHRPDLCRLAADSVARQMTGDTAVMVSDNSGSGHYRSELEANMPSGVQVVGTTDELAMAEHWEWALQQAEDRLRPTHVAFLTDRMIFRDGALHALSDVLASHPDEVVTYNHDGIDNWDPTRVLLQAYVGDGSTYRIDVAQLLDATASGHPVHWSLPRMLNCAVPVTLLAELRAQHGHVFSSISPDYYFGYRVAATRATFLCVNHSLITAHSSRKSNGNSFRIGVETTESRDFRQRSAVGAWKTPYPHLDTVSNAIFHEYSVVRDLTGSDRFPPLCAPGVREQLLRDAGEMIDEDAAARIRAELGLVEAPRGSLVHTVRRRARTAASHPGRSLGPRISYKVVPVRAARPLQSVFPGGIFGTMDAAIEVARAEPRSATHAALPPGAFARADGVGPANTPRPLTSVGSR